MHGIKRIFTWIKLGLAIAILISITHSCISFRNALLAQRQRESSNTTVITATSPEDDLTGKIELSDMTFIPEIKGENLVVQETITRTLTDSLIPCTIGCVEAPSFTARLLPEYKEDLVIVVNNDQPLFEVPTEVECKIELSALDLLGRCGPAMMIAGPETIQTAERGSTGQCKPSGWHQNKYPDVVDSEPPYLYNRSHLMMWFMSGLNDTEENLITGTRYFNAAGMLQVEEEVSDYILTTGEHVKYRVTPIYSGDNLLASGVLMEAASIETDGLRVCRFVYNVQPGVHLDYATGENWLE